jgi:hypothetical protein
MGIEVGVQGEKDVVVVKDRRRWDQRFRSAMLWNCLGPPVQTALSCGGDNCAGVVEEIRSRASSFHASGDAKKVKNGSRRLRIGLSETSNEG